MVITRSQALKTRRIARPKRKANPTTIMTGLRPVPRPRTLNSVQTTLARVATNQASRRVTNLNAYTMCRMNPFVTMGNTVGIPDGSPANKIVADNKMYATFTVGTDGGCVLRMLPVPNMPLLIRPKTTLAGMTINGVTPPTSGTSPPFSGELGWAVLCAPPAWTSYNSANNTANPPPEITNPYNATQFRIVAIALRIFYTGVASNCSGAVTVQSNSFSYLYGGQTAQSAVTYYAYNPATGAIASGSAAAGTVYTCRFDTYSTGQELAPNTQTYRAEQPIFVRLKQNTFDHQWHPIHSGRASPVDTTTYNCPIMAYPEGVNTTIPGFAGVANDWQLTDIEINGALSGSTFRVELATCIEYVPALGSAFQPFAKPSSSLGSKDLPATDRRIAGAPGSNPDTPAGHANANGSVYTPPAGGTPNPPITRRRR